jgi:hypothetical protein
VSGLLIDVAGAVADRYAAAPTILFRLRLAEPAGARVEAVALRCQVRIEPQRRRYTRAEEERLLDLFGETPRWGETLRPFLWAHTSTVVGRFEGTTEVDLPMPCTYDFDVAAAKYLHALGDGEVPLLLLFNGTVFTTGGGTLSVEPVPWHREAAFRMPAAVWRETMDRYFPNSGWIRLRRDTLDALQRFRTERALPTWEQAVDALLKEAE